MHRRHNTCRRSNHLSSGPNPCGIYVCYFFEQRDWHTTNASHIGNPIYACVYIYIYKIIYVHTTIYIRQILSHLIHSFSRTHLCSTLTSTASAAPHVRHCAPQCRLRETRSLGSTRAQGLKSCGPRAAQRVGSSSMLAMPRRNSLVVCLVTLELRAYLSSLS